MNWYISSIVVSGVINFISNRILENKVYKDISYISYNDIGKYNLTNEKNKLKNYAKVLILFLTPGVNIISALLLLGVTMMENKKGGELDIIFKLRKKESDPAELIKVYELQKSLEDSFKLEGLNAEEIKEQIKLGNKEFGYKYISKEAYEDIEASKEALTFVGDMEFNDNLDLSPKQRLKLLKEYRKAFVSCQETMKPIEKTIKFNNNK